MANDSPIAFTRLTDGTLLRRDADGAFRPVTSRTDCDRLGRLTEQEIESLASSDPDHPGLDDAFWASIDDPASGNETVEIDRDVLGFFRKQGGGYRSRINAVLRHYMEAKER